MLIIDGHLDLAWNALQGNRDLSLSAYTTRVLEAGSTVKGQGQGTVGFPEMREGRIALCFATLLARCTNVPVPHLDYPTPLQAHSVALGQLAFYEALEQAKVIRIIADKGALGSHVSEWEKWEETQEKPHPPLGFVISMESADPILKPDQVSGLQDRGVRIIGPAHYGSGRYSGGTGTENGLTDMGYALLREMEHCGLILDLSHFTDRAFWQALEKYPKSVLASHNNCRSLVPHQRQFSDEQLNAIIERDGVIGVALDAWMLIKGFIRGQSTNDNVGMELVADQIDHICQLAGNSRHAAIGSDLDGLFGREQSPHDFDTIADLQRVPEMLSARGYGQKDVSAVMHGNWLRLLNRSWSSNP